MGSELNTETAPAVAALVALRHGPVLEMGWAEGSSTVIAGEVPAAPGLYAVVATDVAAVQRALGAEVPVGEGGLLYVGKAQGSLRGRDLRTHFGTGKTAHSTLRRTFAALLGNALGFVPVPVTNAGKFRLTGPGEEDLTHWMCAHLGLRVWTADGLAKRALAAVERDAINALRPPLNLTHGPSDRRAKAIRRRIRDARRDMAVKAHADASSVQ